MVSWTTALNTCWLWTKSKILLCMFFLMNLIIHCSKPSHRGQWVTQTECLNHFNVLPLFFKKVPGCMIPANWNVLTWLSSQTLCSIKQDTIWRQWLKLQFYMGLMPDIKGCKWHPWWFIASERWITNGNNWKIQEEMCSERYFEMPTLLWHQLSTVILYSS